MDEIAEHEAFIAEVDGLRRVRTIAEVLLALHDDDPQDGRLDHAWTILREVLGDLPARS